MGFAARYTELRSLAAKFFQTVEQTVEVSRLELVDARQRLGPNRRLSFLGRFCFCCLLELLACELFDSDL
jgi:hypothetical protein